MLQTSCEISCCSKRSLVYKISCISLKDLKQWHYISWLLALSLSSPSFFFLAISNAAEVVSLAHHAHIRKWARYQRQVEAHANLHIDFFFFKSEVISTLILWWINRLRSNEIWILPKLVIPFPKQQWDMEQIFTALMAAARQVQTICVILMTFYSCDSGGQGDPS
jgi:hypothetical protein